MSAKKSRAQIIDLLKLLESDSQGERVEAIQVLGDIGDQNALKALRDRMKAIHGEYEALIIAVGKLKRKLGVK